MKLYRIHLHPSFNDDTYLKDFNGSDVAVLALASPVQYSHKIKPVCLPSNPGQDYGNKDAVAAGFGLGEKSNGIPVYYEELMKKIVTIKPDEECLHTTLDLQPRVRLHYNLDNVHILCSHDHGNLAAVREGDSGSALNLRENGRFEDQKMTNEKQMFEALRKLHTE